MSFNIPEIQLADDPVVAATITISASKANPTPLIMSDTEGHSGNTQASDQSFTTTGLGGQSIVWQVAGDISSISSITANANNPNLFSSGPSADNAAKTQWSGTLGSTTGTESYTISYVVDETTYSQDPRIQVNPGSIDEEVVSQNFLARFFRAILRFLGFGSK